MSTNKARVLAAVLLAASLNVAAPVRASQDSAVSVSRQVLEALENKDLDAAEALFASESSVFESGKAEGDWQNYRAHHIGAELAEFHVFEISTSDPEVVSASDESLVMVAWPIEYLIELHDGTRIESVGTITFVLIEADGTYRVRHMHWSSRRKP